MLHVVLQQLITDPNYTFVVDDGSMNNTTAKNFVAVKTNSSTVFNDGSVRCNAQVTINATSLDLCGEMLGTMLHTFKRNKAFATVDFIVPNLFIRGYDVAGIKPGTVNQWQVIIDITACYVRR